MAWQALLLVALGGALGSVARHLASLGVARWSGPGFPWGTLFVNIAGSLLIGLVMAWVLKAGEARENMRLLLVTGVLGGFTTFSSFSWETWRLLEDGRLAAAGANILLSVGLCLLGTAAGVMLARQL